MRSDPVRRIVHDEGMADPTVRVLRLLSLLTSARTRRGQDLADRLGVTPRTVRRDVERLRELGYRVEAAPGPAGGYALGSGRELPPLLLDDEAAVTVAVGLQLAATGAVAGTEDTAVRVAAAPEQVLPAPVPPGRRPADGDGRDRGWTRGRPGGARGPRAGLPGRRAAAVRLRRPDGEGQPPARRAAPPGVHRTSLVPRG